MKWITLWSSQYYTDLREHFEETLREAFKPVQKLFVDLGDECFVMKDNTDLLHTYHIKPKITYGNKLINTKGFYRIEKHARSNCRR